VADRVWAVLSFKFFKWPDPRVWRLERKLEPITSAATVKGALARASRTGNHKTRRSEADGDLATGHRMATALGVPIQTVSNPFQPI